VKSRTVKDYHATLRTLFNWIIGEGALTTSPMERIPVPVDWPDSIEPFTDEQVKALLEASKKPRQLHRDEAMLLFLLDSGYRASEHCGLNLNQVDMSAKKATVESKGARAGWSTSAARRPARSGSICGRTSVPLKIPSSSLTGVNA
jgi:site-specific recombinase XerD